MVLPMIQSMMNLMRFKCKRCKTSFINTSFEQINCSSPNCPIRVSQEIPKKKQDHEEELDFTEFPKETCEIIAKFETEAPQVSEPNFADVYGYQMYD